MLYLDNNPSMKRLIIVLVFSFFGQLIKSQSVSYLSYQYVEIISYSIKITYYGDTYYPSEPYGSSGNILGQLQARYDRNKKMVSDEWGKVEYLELINKSNKEYLEKFKQELRNGMEAWRGADFGYQPNADNCIAYITQIYNDKYIRAELKLLQRCNDELNRIKYSDPDNYPNSKRYKSISMVLSALADCQPSEISSLSWEAYEINGNSLISSTQSKGYSNTTSSSSSNSIPKGKVECYGSSSPKKVVVENNEVWILLNNKTIWYLNGQSWVEYPGNGLAEDISVYNGVPYVIGTDNAVWYGNGSGWNRLAGKGTGSKIYVEDGRIWLIGGGNGIYYNNNSQWYSYSQGAIANELTVFGNEPYVIGSDNAIWYVVNNNWKRIEGNYKYVQYEAGKIWAINSDNNLISYENSVWKTHSNIVKCKSFSIENNLLAVIGVDGKIYTYNL